MGQTTKRYKSGSRYQVICPVSEIEARLRRDTLHRCLWIVAGVAYALALLGFMVLAIM